MKEMFEKLGAWIIYLVIIVAFFWRDKVSEPIGNMIISLWHRLFGLPKVSPSELAERYVALAKYDDYVYRFTLADCMMGIVMIAASLVLFSCFAISEEDRDRARTYVLLAQTDWENIVTNEVVISNTGG